MSAEEREWSSLTAINPSARRSSVSSRRWGLKAQTFRSAQEFMGAKRTFRSVSSSLCDCPG